MGLLGATALERRNNLLLCAYVVACVMSGAALAVYSLLVDYLLSSSCLVVQSAFDGCGACECAGTNTCTAADLGSGARATPHCRDCQAWGSDICKHFDLDARASSLGLTSAFTSLVTVVVSALPACVGQGGADTATS